MTRPTFTIYIYIYISCGCSFFLDCFYAVLGMRCEPHLAERRASEAMPGRLARPWQRAARSLTGACPHLSERRASEAVPGRKNFRHTTHTGHTYSAGRMMKVSVHGGHHQPPGSGTRVLVVRPRKEHVARPWPRAAIHLRAVASPAVSATAARARRLGNQTPEPHSGCKIHRRLVVSTYCASL